MTARGASKHRGFRLCGLAALSCISPAFAVETAPSFRDEVLPILSGHCFECHGFDPGTRFPKDEPLRLDDFASATATRGHGKAIVPGKPAESLVIKRARSLDPDLVMPPPESHKPLSETQIRILERWIAAGAKYERHWAFDAPPDTIPVPATKNPAWAKNPIDSFVLARLEKEQLGPSPPASPERWLRRVTYDLTGLPPAGTEIDAFLADTSPQARERVVERLLASPRFGEHMATHWLDVARYADSFGYQADIATNAWPYRDWVIRAFNDNLPFDQFIIHQLAGDLLPDATREQKLATAFSRIHRKTNEGGSVPEEFRQEGISDRVHTIGTAFMALTMECARCHDHKYDPISMKDYYSMGAFFNSIDEFGIMGHQTGVLPQPTLPLPSPEQETQLATLEKEIAAHEAKLVTAITAAEEAFQSWLSSEKSFPDADLAGRFDFDAETEGERPKANTGPNQIVPGKSGNGVLANGDDAIRLPDFGIRHADQPMSISLWLKPAENHPRAVVFSNSSSADVPYSGYELLLENGRLSWTLAREFPGNAASVATKTTIPVGEWSHVTVTSDGSRGAAGLKIYLNGQAAETTTVADSLTRDYTIGRGLLFSARSRDLGLRGGIIDEIRVHTRAITPVEVAAIHAGKTVGELEASSEQLRDYYISAIDPTTRESSNQLSAARAAYRGAQN
ncbi:MAG TPA: DUF1549 domain-containing protein, partial [Luteolibacter sp.]|nr:DUF1549 domain-containing protein [Luteolibacter sp.]